MARMLWDWGVEEPFAQFRSAVNRLIGELGEDLPRGWGTASLPPVCLSEEAERFVLEVELPGIPMDQLEISCLDRNLTLRGNRKDPGDPIESYERRERPMGAFVRAIEFPAEVLAEKITATLEDGILRVIVPKSERVKPRKIEVRAIASASRQIETDPSRRSETPDSKKGMTGMEE